MYTMMKGFQHFFEVSGLDQDTFGYDRFLSLVIFHLDIWVFPFIIIRFPVMNVNVQ